MYKTVKLNEEFVKRLVSNFPSKRNTEKDQERSRVITELAEATQANLSLMQAQVAVEEANEKIRFIQEKVLEDLQKKIDLNWVSESNWTFKAKDNSTSFNSEVDSEEKSATVEAKPSSPRVQRGAVLFGPEIYVGTWKSPKAKETVEEIYSKRFATPKSYASKISEDDFIYLISMWKEDFMGSLKRDISLFLIEDDRKAFGLEELIIRQLIQDSGVQESQKKQLLLRLDDARKEAENFADTKVSELNYKKAQLYEKVSVQSNKEPARKTVMSTIMEKAKERGESALYRTISKKVTRGTKQGFLKMLKSKGADDGTLQWFGGFINTELGESILSIMIGVGLEQVGPRIPGIGNNEKISRLAEEFQIEGGAVAIDAVTAEFMQFFGPVFIDAVASLKEGERARVEEPAFQDEEERVKHEEAVQKAQARA
jgi:hypothetical protein